MSQHDTMSGEEAIAMLQAFVCECGYSPNDSDHCFRKDDDGYLFECPNCGDTWKLVKAGHVV